MVKQLTVPDLGGLAYEELENYLSQRELRFEVEEDSGYSAELPTINRLETLPYCWIKGQSESKTVYKP